MKFTKSEMEILERILKSGFTTIYYDYRKGSRKKSAAEKLLHKKMVRLVSPAYESPIKLRAGKAFPEDWLRSLPI